MNNKNSWFDGVFLKSLFDQVGANNAKWITAKQVNICRDYMRQECNRTQNADGVFCTHTAYSYIWCGRKVLLQYSGKNGCGTIIFYSSEKELLQAREDAKTEKARIESEQLARLARHPERMQKRIADAKLKLENAVLWLKDDIEEGASEQEIKEDKETINNLQNDLNKLLAVQNLEV